MMRALVVSILLVLPAAQASAETVHENLYSALRLSEIATVFQREGIEDAQSTVEMYVQDGSSVSSAEMSLKEIYDLDAMEAFILEHLSDRLEAKNAEVALSFFQTPLGMTLAGLETSAREAISDDTVESYAIELANELERRDAQRYQTLRQNLDDTGLIELNMAGAFAAQYAFLDALSEDDQIALSDADILRLFESNEAELRQDIIEWLMAFSTMAYSPLELDEIQVYFDFLQSSAGVEMQKALFASFNTFSVQKSVALGNLIVRLRSSQSL